MNGTTELSAFREMQSQDMVPPGRTDLSLKAGVFHDCDNVPAKPLCSSSEFSHSMSAAS